MPIYIDIDEQDPEALEPTPRLRYHQTFNHRFVEPHALTENETLEDRWISFFRTIRHRPQDLHDTYTVVQITTERIGTQVKYTYYYFGTVATRDHEGRWIVQIVDYVQCQSPRRQPDSFHPRPYEIERRNDRLTIGSRFRTPARVVEDLATPFPSLARTSRRARAQ